MTLDDTIEIAVEGEAQERVVDYGTPLGELLPKAVGGLPVLAALANNDGWTRRRWWTCGCGR